MEFCFIGFISCLILWFLFDEMQQETNQAKRYEAMKIKQAFYCTDCHHVYASTENLESCPCPRCNKKNTYLRF